MADKKISELADGGALQDTDEIVVARSGTNVKIAGSEFGGGGGTFPDPATFPRGVYDNAPPQVVTTGGTTIQLPIGYDYGDEVLDITDPANPLVIVAGIYSVWVEVYGDGAETSTPSLALNMGVDANSDWGYAPIEGTCSALESLGMGLTYYCREGSSITITAGQSSGSDKTYHALLVIQRLTPDPA